MPKTACNISIRRIIRKPERARTVAADEVALFTAADVLAQRGFYRRWREICAQSLLTLLTIAVPALLLFTIGQTHKPTFSTRFISVRVWPVTIRQPVR